MCGIFFQLSKQTQAPPERLQGALRARGPDAYGEHIHHLQELGLQLRFVSTVLGLRGHEVVKQPLENPVSSSALCWNGEAWKIRGIPVVGNDTQAVFDLLLKPHRRPDHPESQESIIDDVVESLACVEGPYAFVFYHAEAKLLFYGRDCLGRRSLIQEHHTDSLTLSSISDPVKSTQGWCEVEADGIYVIDLVSVANVQSKSAEQPIALAATKVFRHQYTFPELNRMVPTTIPSQVPNSAVQALHGVLRAAIRARVTDIRPHKMSSCQAGVGENSPSGVAVLFSGGLDCSLIARIMHDLIPMDVSFELLNVAFENPRIHKTGIQNNQDEKSPYELCPDRITARKSHAELQRICSGRKWNLVEIDVPYSETLQHREAVINLMHPHDTEMDLSIAIALYFAARGKGFVTTTDGRLPYTCSTRVLLSGLGADELFGGYQRHATAYTRHGFSALLDELDLDFSRLGKRNLGRDDRVISHWGKEVRFPYLDEQLVSWALSAPVWEKCGFGMDLPGKSVSRPSLDAEKRVLRLLAYELGLRDIAAEKKRAIQFGARSAKMQAGRVKGTQTLSH